jgi:hypothetical protein
MGKLGRDWSRGVEVTVPVTGGGLITRILLGALHPPPLPPRDNAVPSPAASSKAAPSTGTGAGGASGGSTAPGGSAGLSSDDSDTDSTSKPPAPATAAASSASAAGSKAAVVVDKSAAIVDCMEEEVGALEGVFRAAALCKCCCCCVCWGVGAVGLCSPKPLSPFHTPVARYKSGWGSLVGPCACAAVWYTPHLAVIRFVCSCHQVGDVLDRSGGSERRRTYDSGLFGASGGLGGGGGGSDSSRQANATLTPVELRRAATESRAAVWSGGRQVPCVDIS